MLRRKKITKKVYKIENLNDLNDFIEMSGRFNIEEKKIELLEEYITNAKKKEDVYPDLKKMKLDSWENSKYSKTFEEIVNDIDLKNYYKNLINIIENKNMETKLLSICVRDFYDYIKKSFIQQQDANDILISISEIINLNSSVDISTTIKCIDPAKSQEPKIEKHNILSIGIINGINISDLIMNSQKEEKLNGYEGGDAHCKGYTTKEDYIPTGNNLFIQLKRYGNDNDKFIKNTKIIEPSKLIEFNGEQFFKLDSCIVHIGDRKRGDESNGHYIFQMFDDKGNATTIIDDDKIYDYNKIKGTTADYLNNGYIYLYKKIESDGRKSTRRKSLRRKSSRRKSSRRKSLRRKSSRRKSLRRKSLRRKSSRRKSSRRTGKWKHCKS